MKVFYFSLIFMSLIEALYDLVITGTGFDNWNEVKVS